MNKLKKFALLLSALILCGCNNSAAEETLSTSEQTTAPAQTENVTVTETVTEKEEKSPAEMLPIMDGSTSATPLEIGLKAGKLGISFSEAKALVSHTTTHDSFKRLINGEVDMIFSVPISEEQQKMADDAGVKLTMKPVAKEGFVFVVNGQNPVDSLTTEQIKDIYSGKITNWSQVGGNDLEILPYQRNTDSGSQNYMTEFMGDTPLSKPKTELIAVGMGGLMDAVATYDNSEGAVGYSVYSYAAQMYANANKVKFIAIDGIEPSKASMADESYPLLSNTYIIYTDKAPEGVKEFTDWALSDEGQKWVLESGYLPVNGMEIPDKYMTYDALGTGKVMEKGAKPDINFSFLSNQGIGGQDTGYYKVNCLKNKEFQNQINEDIKNAVNEIKSKLGSGAEISYDNCCKNGFLSITVGNRNPDIYLGMSSYDYNAYNYAITLNYDLIENKKIEHFSDLFYKDTDFLPLVNNGLSDMISHYFLPQTRAEQKIDFMGILGEPRLFTIDSVGFEADNPYFSCGVMLQYADYAFNDRIYDMSLVGEYRDMSGVFEENSKVEIENSRYPEWIMDYFEEDGVYFAAYADSRFHSDKEVALKNEALYMAQHIAKDYFESMGETFSENNPERIFILNSGLDENFWTFSLEYVSMNITAHIDTETLALLTPEDILGKGWEKNVKDYDGNSYDEDYGNLCLCHWSKNESGITAYFLRVDAPGIYTAEVPYENVNHRYIRKSE